MRRFDVGFGACDCGWVRWLAGSLLSRTDGQIEGRRPGGLGRVAWGMVVWTVVDSARGDDRLTHVLALALLFEAEALPAAYTPLALARNTRSTTRGLPARLRFTERSSHSGMTHSTTQRPGRTFAQLQAAPKVNGAARESL